MVNCKYQSGSPWGERTTIVYFDMDPTQFFIPSSGADIRISVLWHSIRCEVVVNNITTLKNILLDVIGATNEAFGKQVELQGIP